MTGRPAGPMEVPHAPCSTCPYRCDTPPGIWHADEYAKLTEYDDDQDVPALGVFLCHRSTSTGVDTVCRGWLTVAGDSVAVRLALMLGTVTVEQRDAPVAVDLYPSGAAAQAAGERPPDEIGSDAERAQAKLLRAGIGRTRREQPSPVVGDRLASPVDGQHPRTSPPTRRARQGS